MAGGEASLLLRIKTAGEEALKKAEESFDSLKTAAIGAFAIISAVVVKSIADYRQSEVATNALTQSMVNNGIYSKQLSLQNFQKFPFQFIHLSISFIADLLGDKIKQKPNDDH